MASFGVVFYSLNQQPIDTSLDVGAIAKDGPLHLGGIAARFSGRLEAMRAGADWLVNNGYAAKSSKGEYKATPKGMTRAALCWNQ